MSEISEMDLFFVKGLIKEHEAEHGAISKNLDLNTVNTYVNTVFNLSNFEKTKELYIREMQYHVKIQNVFGLEIQETTLSELNLSMISKIDACMKMQIPFKAHTMFQIKVQSEVFSHLLIQLNEKQVAQEIRNAHNIFNMSIETKKEILQLGLMFKFINSREELLKNIPLVTKEYLPKSYTKNQPISEEEIIKELKHIENTFILKSIESKLQKPIPPPLDLGLSQKELQSVYTKLYSDKELDSNTKLSDFISAFCGQPTPPEYSKIKWKNNRLLSILVNDYIDSPKKWAMSELLFVGVKNLSSVYSNAKNASNFKSKVEYLNRLLKK